MSVRLSVVVPTLGRPTLARTLKSIAEQASDDDEIILVAAENTQPNDVLRQVPTKHPAWPMWRFLACLHSGPGRGDAERNLGMQHAAGTHLAFMDDDDVYLPGAFDAMREHAGDLPVMFRIDYSNRGLGVIWSEPVLRYANVSTQMIVVPNDPARLAAWAPYQETEACDWVFIRDTCARMGEPVWREEIIAQIRPDQLGG